MTLMLLDSASLWYRAYYGMPDTLLSPSGEPINAIKGFLDMSARLMQRYQPTRFVACLDGDWRPSWRVELFPEYKANRLDGDGDEEEPDLLTPQIPLLLEVLDIFNIPIVGVDDYEADDVIATYSLREKGPTRIVTGDRDLFQLVDDARDVKVAYLAKGISAHDLVDRKFIEEKYGIPGDRYALFAMIRGDASDGLPGIRGIGEKGAATIAQHFSTLDEAIQAAANNDDRLPNNVRKKLLEGREYALIAPKLVHCALDVPLPDIDLSLPQQLPTSKEINRLKSEHGLGSSIDRFYSVVESLQ